ncbi:MAG: transporter substrate-binding domain-containing protein [Oscillospiraceae bacterium]|nr:transporter substrate-binding domain-containing protein [Oscillospiraceae bacterium]
MKRKVALLLSLLLLTTLALSACGTTSDSGATEAPATAGGTEQTATGTEALQTITAGKLTVATGEPAWEPWVQDDDPASGKGFEAAFAYALAAKLGYAKDDVIWVRTGFEEAIQPGPKTWDFNLQQFSITEERKAVVDFTSLYYKEPLAVITTADNEFAGATTIEELKGALFGAASGDVAYEYTRTAVAPTQEVALFNDLAATLQALNAGQIDAAIVGVTTAFYNVYIDDEQIQNGVIVGRLAGSENAGEGYGLLLEKGSPLTAPLSEAIDALAADGTIDALSVEWLGDYNDVPVLQ